MRCESCRGVHPIQREREKLANIRIIVNKDGTSRPYYISLPAKDDLRVGNELLVDDGHQDIVLAEITSLETDRRVEAAPVGEVKTVWARAVDEVTVKVSVYRNGLTQSLKSSTQGDEIFGLGEVREIDGIKFKITKIKLRGEGFADEASAKDILRVWGREL